MMEREIYQKNIDLLKIYNPMLKKKIEIISEREDLYLVKAKDGSFTCRLDKGEKNYYLHSRYSPKREAERLIDFQSFNEPTNWVLLGLGLGYHLFSLFERILNRDRVVVIEKEIYLFKLSLKVFDWEKILKSSQIKLVIGADKRELEEVMEEINEDRRLRIVFHELLFNLYHDYYIYLKERLNKVRERIESLRNIRKIIESLDFDYPKFKRDHLSILTFTTPETYLSHIINDCVEAFRELGHKVKMINIKGDFKIDRENMQILMREIQSFRPDFVFALNQFGIAPHLLKAMKVPHACWFLDEPKYAGWEKKYVSFYYVMFVCDREFVKDYRDKLFHIHYLPLATNKNIFKKIHSQEKLDSYSCEVSFIGNSNLSFYKNFIKVLEEYSQLKDILEEIIQIQKEDPLLSIRDIKEEVERKLAKKLCFKDPFIEDEILGRLELAAMVLYRKEVLENLTDFDLHVYGDEGWKNLLPEKVKFRSYLDYHKELPYLYNASKINLSITTAQIKSAVTHRVYDVSACRAFVISDYRKDLDILFKPGEEVIYFKEKKELPELVRYYLDHQEEREKIAKNAQERVLREHTYYHRMKELVVFMERIFRDNLS